MDLQEFTRDLLGKKFNEIPPGFIRIHPDIHKEAKDKVGKASDPKLIGKLEGVNIYADSSMREGEAKFIDRNGVVTILLPEENDPKPKKKAKNKRKKSKARSVSTKAP